MYDIAEGDGHHLAVHSLPKRGLVHRAQGPSLIAGMVGNRDRPRMCPFLEQSPQNRMMQSSNFRLHNRRASPSMGRLIGSVSRGFGQMPASRPRVSERSRPMQQDHLGEVVGRQFAREFPQNFWPEGRFLPFSGQDAPTELDDGQP
jgi:hypothetical protein